MMWTKLIVAVFFGLGALSGCASTSPDGAQVSEETFLSEGEACNEIVAFSTAFADHFARANEAILGGNYELKNRVAGTLEDDSKEFRSLTPSNPDLAEAIQAQADATDALTGLILALSETDLRNGASENWTQEYSLAAEDWTASSTTIVRICDF